MSYELAIKLLICRYSSCNAGVGDRASIWRRITAGSPRTAGPVCASWGARACTLAAVSSISGSITSKGMPSFSSNVWAAPYIAFAKLQANTAAICSRARKAESARYTLLDRLRANNSVVIQQYWWRWVFTAAIFGVCTICINLVGDALRDAVDPKSNGR